MEDSMASLGCIVPPICTKLCTDGGLHTMMLYSCTVTSRKYILCRTNVLYYVTLDFTAVSSRVDMR